MKKLRIWHFALTLVILGIIGLITPPIMWIPILVLSVTFSMLKKNNMIEEITAKDIVLSSIFFLMFVFIIMGITTFALASVGWIKYIIVTVICSVIAWLSTSIENTIEKTIKGIKLKVHIGDLIGGTIAFCVAWSIIGGISGLIIGSICVLVITITTKVPFANNLFVAVPFASILLIVLKLASIFVKQFAEGFFGG